MRKFLKNLQYSQSKDSDLKTHCEARNRIRPWKPTAKQWYYVWYRENIFSTLWSVSQLYYYSGIASMGIFPIHTHTHTHTHTQDTYIYIYIYINFSNIYFFFLCFHHATCENTCDTLASSAANQGDNTVSVAQGGTATPGATEQLLPPDRVFKRNIYLCMYKIN